MEERLADIQPVSRTEFDRVDHSDNPTARVHYLDLVAKTIDYKRESIDALGLGPGDCVLDVGCGTGDDVRMIAELVAPNGRAFGLDNSSTMIAEARQRALLSGQAEIIGFFEGSAYHIPFVDDALDATRADRLFQHLNDPMAALTEMRRVTRPGGLVNVLDADWETLVVDVPDRLLFRKIRGHFLDSKTSRYSGSRLFGQFDQVGLRDVKVSQPIFVTVTDYTLANQICDFTAIADDAYAAGAISPHEYAEWRHIVRALQNSERVFMGIAMVGVVGTKP